MNTIKNITLFLLFLTISFSCVKDDDELPSYDNVPAPSNLSVTFNITQDNTGLVTIFPTADGATKFLITFGDTIGGSPVEYALGEAITHTYEEGVYTVGISAVGINGKTTSIEEELNVTFKAPENLVVTIEEDAVNPRIISVSATADYATIMDVYFGDTEDETPVHVLPEEVVTHTYADTGNFILRVIAKSAGAATTEFSDTITISPASDPVNLPITFESFTVNYAFTDFGNLISSVINNPDASGINTSSRVAQSVKPSGAETWAGTYLTLENPIDFSTNKLFKVKVWSPKSGDTVRLKVENLDNGDIFAEVNAVSSTTNEWEELSFDFSSIDTDNEYQKVVLFFDFGNAGDDNTYYFDDVKLLSSGATTLPVEDFEGEAPEFTVFGNIADIEVVANPDQSGANITANTAKMTKTAGSETWAGAYFEVDAPLDLDNYSKIKVSTWSPTSGINVKLKLENSDASVTHEVDITNTTASAWEDLTYDFSAAPATDYMRIVIFFDFDNAGDDSEYYFDEIELVTEGGSSQPLIFEDFEGEAPAFTAFGNIADIVVLANPDQSGVNTTANCAQLTKTAGAETWAGCYFELASALDLNSYSNISVKTWSPVSGIVVKVKLENSDASITHEVDITNTTANAWEELVYDFSDAPVADFIRVVIFFDFGNAGDDTIYYFDEYTLTN